MVRFTVDNRNRLIFYGNPVGYVKADMLLWGMKNMKQIVSGASSPPSNVWRN